MPRVAVPVTAITRTGVAPTAEVNGDPANNHSIVNDGKTYLLVRNSDAGAPRTVTVRFTAGAAVDGQLPAPRTYPIPATETRRIGPWPTQWYGQSLEVDVDHANLKLNAYSLGP